jgi:hypothetical protein
VVSRGRWGWSLFSERWGMVMGDIPAGRKKTPPEF